MDGKKTTPPTTGMKESLVPEKLVQRRSFLAFAGFIGLNLAAFGAWKLLRQSPTEQKGITGGVQKPLRKALDKSELATRKLFSHDHLVRTYPKSLAAKKVRENGRVGLTSVLKREEWRLEVIRSTGQSLLISLPEIRSLPKTELVFDFKCVEGWDQIQYWGGIKFSDFIKHFGLQPEAALSYVGFETPDKKYYVGIDIESAMHPQTILAYEMNASPLKQIHGAPLRLITPVKYGIKNIKRIGTMSFSNQRPRDYWAENGYDYYSGL